MSTATLALDAPRAKRTLDPTGTIALRRSFRAAAQLRLRQLRAAMRVAVVDHDVLALGGGEAIMAYHPADVRLRAFNAWLDSTARAIFAAHDWLRPWVEKAWASGVRAAVAEVGLPPAPLSRDHEHLVQLARIEVDGVLGVIVQRASRQAELIVALSNVPRWRAFRQLGRVFDDVGKARMDMLADTMVVKAFNNAKLEMYRAAGLERVGIMPEMQRGTPKDASRSGLPGPATRYVASSHRDVPDHLPPRLPFRAYRGEDAAASWPVRPAPDMPGAATGDSSRIGLARPAGFADARRRKRHRRGYRTEALVGILTSGDDRVCERCQDLADDAPYSLDQAKALIPRHPRCRCAVFPWTDPRFKGEESYEEDAGPPDEPRDLHGRWTGGGDDPVTRAHLAFPAVEGGRVDGLAVRKDVPNLSSISASFNEGEYTILRGIRSVPFSAFEAGGHPSITKRTEALAAEIVESGEINPLIIAIDKNGPYVLEGGHRWDALQIAGKTKLPAVVVVKHEAVEQPKGGGFSLPEVPQAMKERIQGIANKVANDLGFDKSRISVSEKEHPFKLNDKEYMAAGVAYTRGGGEGHQQGDVVLFPKQMGGQSDEAIAGIAAHEIEHQKFQWAMDEHRREAELVMSDPGPPPKPESENWWERSGGGNAVMRPDGTLFPPYDKKYPAYEAVERAFRMPSWDDFREGDGVSDYSKQYWDQFDKDKSSANYEKAVHETLAEMAFTKYMTSKFPEHYGYSRMMSQRGATAENYFPRPPQAKIDKGQTLWRNLYRVVEKLYRAKK